MWGVIKQTDEFFEKTVHVVPVDDEGQPLPPHEPKNCSCHPEVEHNLIIHNMIQ